MAAITRVGTPSPSSDIPQNCKLTLPAGEAISAGDCCYIKSDGKFWRCEGDADAAAAQFYGMATAAASAGEPVTCAHSIRFRYGSGMTPGASVFLDPTATTGDGLIADANATVTQPIGLVIDATRIEIFQPFRDRTV